MHHSFAKIHFNMIFVVPALSLKSLRLLIIYINKSNYNAKINNSCHTFSLLLLKITSYKNTTQKSASIHKKRMYLGKLRIHPLNSSLNRTVLDPVYVWRHHIYNSVIVNKKKTLWNDNLLLLLWGGVFFLIRVCCKIF